MGSVLQRSGAEATEAPPAAMLPPITIIARKLGGEPASAEISPSETVRRLKEMLAPHFEVTSHQCKLIFQASPLEDAEVLADRGIVNDAEISVVIMPPIPRWADGLGLSGEHPVLLRDYYARSKLHVDNHACGWRD